MCQYSPPMIRPMPMSRDVTVIGRDVFTPGRIVNDGGTPKFIQHHLGTVLGQPWDDTVRSFGQRVGRLRRFGGLDFLDLP